MHDSLLYGSYRMLLTSILLIAALFSISRSPKTFEVRWRYIFRSDSFFLSASMPCARSIRPFRSCKVQVSQRVGVLFSPRFGRRTH